MLSTSLLTDSEFLVRTNLLAHEGVRPVSCLFVRKHAGQRGRFIIIIHRSHEKSSILDSLLLIWRLRSQIFNPASLAWVHPRRCPPAMMCSCPLAVPSPNTTLGPADTAQFGSGRSGLWVEYTGMS